MTVSILVGDCRAMLATLPEKSVQCVVTSPPYFGLRSYDGGDAEIGQEPTPDEFVAALVEVFRGVRRVLRDDGTVFLNLGDSYAGSQRAAACDKDGREPAGSPERDCLCGNLCGACLAAYRIGKSHSGGQHAPTLAASSFGSIRERTGSPAGHPPTSDCSIPVAHIEDAISRRSQTFDRAGAPLLASPESMLGECAQPHQGANHQLAPLSGCLLCGQTLPPDAQGIGRNSACTCDTGSKSAPSDQSMSDISSSGSAYLDYTTTFRSKPKDLLGIPWRVAFALQSDGWFLRSEIIWHKKNPMPESVTDRPTKAHEQVFLLTKRPTYFYDAHAVAEPGVGRETFFGSEAYSKGSGRNDSGSYDATSCSTRNRRSVWTIASQPFSGAHFATMPPELATTCIKAGTSERGQCPHCGAPWVRQVERTAMVLARSERTHEKGRTRSSGTMLEPPRSETIGWLPSCACPEHQPVPQMVLDPFGGAGTTALAADRLQRDSTIIELNPAYAAIARERINGESSLFSPVAAE